LEGLGTIRYTQGYGYPDSGGPHQPEMVENSSPYTIGVALYGLSI